MKESFYLRHDYNSRNDEKILKLRRKYPNGAGYGIYWMIIEKLAESSEGRIKFKDIDDVAFELHLDSEWITDVIRGYNLFNFDDTYFWSNRLLCDLRTRGEKSKKAILANKVRWGKQANLIQMDTERSPDGIQIDSKERKGEDIKEEERREKENKVDILSNDNTDESEPLENQDIQIVNPNESLVVEKEKEKSSAKKEKESYGNEDINRMLGTIKELLHLSDFKETQKLQRQYGLHLVNLKNKLGKEEFGSRFMQLAQDEFHLKNMGSLKYVYNQIKGFVPIKKDTSIPSFGVDPTIQSN